MNIKYYIETWDYNMTDAQLIKLMDIIPSGDWSKDFEEHNSVEGQNWKL